MTIQKYCYYYLRENRYFYFSLNLLLILKKLGTIVFPNLYHYLKKLLLLLLFDFAKFRLPRIEGYPRGRFFHGSRQHRTLQRRLRADSPHALEVRLRVVSSRFQSVPRAFPVQFLVLLGLHALPGPPQARVYVVEDPVVILLIFKLLDGAHSISGTHVVIRRLGNLNSR